jgi:N-acetylmuramoyl-L-alanine amidase
VIIRDANLRFKTPPAERRQTRAIVVHHTAGNPRQSVHDIHAFHLQRGWSGIGYNVVQTDDGEWWQGRGVDKVGAHATNHNSNTIGICLTGNFEDNPVPAPRWRSLVEMCAHLCRTYGLAPKDIVGHRDLPGAATLCPGRHMDMALLLADVAALLSPAPEPEPSPLPPLEPLPPLDPAPAPAPAEPQPPAPPSAPDTPTSEELAGRRGCLPIPTTRKPQRGV